MTDDPPPWARKDPPPPPPPVRAGGTPAPEPVLPTLFGDGSDLLFPASGGRPRVPDKLPDAPRAARRLRTETDRPAATAQPAAPPPGRRPPPMPAPATVPADGGPDVPDPRVGVIAGPIETTDARRSSPGFTTLLVAAVVTVAAIAGRALAAGVPAAVLVFGIFAPLIAVGALRLAGRGSSASTTVRKFAVQPAGGRRLSCALEGEVPPDTLRTGDLIRVNGRLRDGQVAARSVEVLASLNGPVIRAVAGRRPAQTALVEGLSFALAALMLISTALILLWS